MPAENNQYAVINLRAQVNKKEMALRTKWNKLSNDVQEKAKKEFDLEDALANADKPEVGDFSDTALDQLQDYNGALDGYAERLDEVLRG